MAPTAAFLGHKAKVLSVERLQPPIFEVLSKETTKVVHMSLHLRLLIHRIVATMLQLMSSSANSALKTSM